MGYLQLSDGSKSALLASIQVYLEHSLEGNSAQRNSFIPLSLSLAAAIPDFVPLSAFV